MHKGFYGHHHAETNWGASPYAFNPDREWQPEELQLNAEGGMYGWGTGQTPCTERFHPFSIPSRDCLGKGFALTEMRILLPKLLCDFQLSIPAGSELQSVSPDAADDVYVTTPIHFDFRYLEDTGVVRQTPLKGGRRTPAVSSLSVR